MFVKLSVAVNTKRYEVAFFVVPEVASGLDVVHLEIFRAATMLAAPAVAGEYLVPQFPVRFWIES
jgi:hypothetical protein